MSAASADSSATVPLYIPCELVGVQPRLGRRRKGFADPVGVELLHIRILVRHAQHVRSVQRVQDRSAFLREFLIEGDRLPAATDAAAKASSSFEAYSSPLAIAMRTSMPPTSSVLDVQGSSGVAAVQSVASIGNVVPVIR